MKAPAELAAEAQRQQALLDAIWHGAPGAAVQGLQGDDASRRRGEQAYRVNARALSERALAAVYPRLQEALGADEFAVLAWTLWRRHPPTRGDLACWGQVLPEFLAAQPGMDAALVDTARLEWALHEAERAADAELDAGSLGLLSTQAPAQLRLRLRPGLCVLEQAVTGLPLLVWRQGWRGEFRALDPGEVALLRGLLAGQDLEQALGAALAADARFDFSLWLGQALTLGWLWRVEPHSGS